MRSLCAASASLPPSDLCCCTTVIEGLVECAVPCSTYSTCSQHFFSKLHMYFFHFRSAGVHPIHLQQGVARLDAEEESHQGSFRSFIMVCFFCFLGECLPLFDLLHWNYTAAVSWFLWSGCSYGGCALRILSWHYGSRASSYMCHSSGQSYRELLQEEGLTGEEAKNTDVTPSS